MAFLSRFFTWICVLGSLWYHAGCRKKTQTVYQDQPFEALCSQGYRFLERNKYKEAQGFFTEAEMQHPLHAKAPEVLILGAYAAYKAKEYVESALILDRIILLFPEHPWLAYSHYLRALCYYRTVLRPLSDSRNAEKALDAFETIVSLFPNTPYATDSLAKKALMIEHLATKERLLAEWHWKKKSVIGALSRYQSLVQRYPTSTQVPEALYRIVVCHSRLGLRREALSLLDILKTRYRENIWTARTNRFLQACGWIISEPIVASTLDKTIQKDR